MRASNHDLPENAGEGIGGGYTSGADKLLEGHVRLSTPDER